MHVDERVDGEARSGMFNAYNAEQSDLEQYAVIYTIRKISIHPYTYVHIVRMDTQTYIDASHTSQRCGEARTQSGLTASTHGAG